MIQICRPLTKWFVVSAVGNAAAATAVAAVAEAAAEMCVGLAIDKTPVPCQWPVPGYVTGKITQTYCSLNMLKEVLLKMPNYTNMNEKLYPLFM